MNNNTRSFTKLTEKKSEQVLGIKSNGKTLQADNIFSKTREMVHGKVSPLPLICEDTKIRERLPALKGRKTDAPKNTRNTDKKYCQAADLRIT